MTKHPQECVCAQCEDAAVDRKAEFRRELASLLNRYSMENESNTPDYMLADYLIECLRALDRTIRTREQWYGRNPDRGPGTAVLRTRNEAV